MAQLEKIFNWFPVLKASRRFTFFFTVSTIGSIIDWIKLFFTVPKLTDRINRNENFTELKLLLLIMTLTANRIVDMVTEQLDGKPTADR